MISKSSLSDRKPKHLTYMCVFIANNVMIINGNHGNCDTHLASASNFHSRNQIESPADLMKSKVCGLRHLYKLDLLSLLNIQWEMCSSFGAIAGVDIVITVAMIVLLHRSMTGIKRAVDKASNRMQWKAVKHYNI
ncbi:hypothetical protein D9757_011191 [Collybiopsis confluens]|uniref:Uncharacterized protein n=1 Tax=Collybiopsis confluens TaxID=2823264 RepID=A0A8H5H306_9AGAR|nr:hypothetical protein D9757_011191 [Collybiopsis confluens]